MLVMPSRAALLAFSVVPLLGACTSHSSSSVSRDEVQNAIEGEKRAEARLEAGIIANQLHDGDDHSSAEMNDLLTNLDDEQNAAAAATLATLKQETAVRARRDQIDNAMRDLGAENGSEAGNQTPPD